MSKEVRRVVYRSLYISAKELAQVCGFSYRTGVRRMDEIRKKYDLPQRRRVSIFQINEVLRRDGIEIVQDAIQLNRYNNTPN